MGWGGSLNARQSLKAVNMKEYVYSTVSWFFLQWAKSGQEPHGSYGSHIEEQDMTVCSTPNAWANLDGLHDAHAAVVQFEAPSLPPIRLIGLRDRLERE